MYKLIPPPTLKQNINKHAHSLGGPSIACSSSAAVEWDKQFQLLASEANGECSGRAIDVHNAAYEDALANATGAVAKAAAEAAKKKEAEEPPRKKARKA